MRLVVAIWVVCVLPAVALAEEPKRERLLVLDFQATEGVEAAMVNIAHDRFIATVSGINRFELATSNDLRMMLQTEQQRQLLECADDSCMAEIAGALGARYLSRGRLSLLDKDVVLTLQLFDSESVSLDNQVTSALPAGTDALGSKVEDMTYSLLRVDRTVEEDRWYENTWLWVGVGVVVAGGVTAAILASGGGDDAAPNLGRFTFDG